ncbi:MAG TPA: serine hydrolase domain-containing protein [Nocardioides sp.]|uniref:serine hydrolase domain-containing protein n=1 Tax=Nocardioides sp. TaxID=35761 RepID=UPI002F3EF6A4
MSSLQETTTRQLRRIALDKQREGRVPGLFAGVARGGSLLWGEGIGQADLGEGRAPGPDDQFLIASNTKTFIAVMVMQLRDEGRLSLDDLLGDHVPEVSHPITIRQCLAHVSGMAREPLGDVWETLENPTAKELRRDFDDVERVLRPHDHWHYSNVVFAMLGQLIEELDGRSWEESLRTRLLQPLEMTRTSNGFDGGPHATGYYVAPYDDVPRPEPVMDLKALAPCGGLASTASDLAKWSAFVADPGDLLSADTLEEMCQPQILLTPENWNAAMGLGLFLIRTGGGAAGRTYVGHTGGMPGHITGVFTHRESGTGGIVLMNNSAPVPPDAFAIELADHVVEHDPVEPEPWRPGTEIPDEFRGVLGRWFSEGQPFAFWVEQGELRARIDKPAAATLAPSRFVKVSEDGYRDVAGRERGELLRITRDADGTVTKLNWATYLFTREPIAFGEHLPR